jgi:inosine/xanthosine triphosphatase
MSIQIAIGSENPSKLRAAHLACTRIFPDTSYVLLSSSVPSGVSPQPLSLQETMQGALNRAQAALAHFPTADYGIGMEGGLECIDSDWFECGWMAVVERKSGRHAFGSTARVYVGKGVVEQLVVHHKELSEVVDEMTMQNDVRSKEGFMGIVTNGALKRDECYMHGIIFAFAPFISNPKYWE